MLNGGFGIVMGAGLASVLEMISGGKGLFVPGGNYRLRPPRQALVLSPGIIPTTDIYLRGRLETRFGVAVRYVDVLKTSPNELRMGEDVLVVVVRHAPSCWLRWLEDQKSRLAGVVYLMDDDIPAAARTRELPFRYALKTGWRYALARRHLGRLCSEVWVSTPELAKRYARSSPKLCEPTYLGQEKVGEPAPVYFYHGTWAHRREIEWLVPIVRQVQKTVPGAWFEITGTDRVRRLYRGIPRVRVVHPMPWKDYLAYAGTVRYQAGLAPCFDTPFNRARSHSKMFDITRLGAAGIFSNLTPYKEKVIHGETGLLCDNVPKKWVAALTLLLTDGGLRSSLYLQARSRCQA